MLILRFRYLIALRKAITCHTRKIPCNSYCAVHTENLKDEPVGLLVRNRLEERAARPGSPCSKLLFPEEYDTSSYRVSQPT